MDVLTPLKNLLEPDKICIDNKVFRICTKVTFVLLTTFSILVTSRQYIGDPIDCIVEVIPQKIMDTYCWFYSTYTLSNRLIGIAGKDIVQPGVASHSEFGDTIKYHSYYQWVCFALFFQAILSYIPRYIWKCFENGRIKVLADKLKEPLAKKEDKDKHMVAMINYFKDNLNQQCFYAYRFFLCEVLNVAVAIGQIYFADIFLDGEFLWYGSNVMQQHEVDTMTRVFPKLTKCSFHKYGPSGTIQNFDGLCVLPVNIINEKIYLFLWFWFIGIIILSTMALIYRAFVCCSSKLRLHLLRSRARFASRRDIDYILLRFDIGDWFILYQLSKNIDPITFKFICRDLFRKLYIDI
ncbi:innexin inx2-like [Sitodiplosis mosellana]|uniref:innexin inx2-like n=1 Tax=Sitodiplosis mosellana TaxID=263140 RepID=UPI002444CB87|nr:innexin inx2-like [Sitodiplosis mosellana]